MSESRATTPRRRQLAGRLSASATRLRQLAARSVEEFFQDGGPKVAAAISYYALFSIFPIAILTVAVFGLVAAEESVRAQVVDFLLRNLPLSPGEGRTQLRAILDDVTASPGAFGLVGVAGLAFAASGVMGAIRHGLNVAWDTEDPRPPVQGKLLDVLLVLGVGLLVVLSLVLTVLARLVGTVGAELEATLGPAGGAVAGLLLGLRELVPLALSLIVFAFLYRVVPAADTRLGDVWPGVLVAGVGYEAAKTGFSLYLENFADYGAVYGSISLAVAFLFFVFVAANVFLLGAEVASEWPRVRSGHYDRQEALEPERSLRDRVRDLARRLVVGDREPSGDDGDRAP